MKIAIIGISGQMGKWFASYFIQNNHEIKGYDINLKGLSKLSENLNFEASDSLQKAIDNVDLILVTVSLEESSSTLLKLVTLAKSGVTIIDVSSIKSSVFNVLKQLSEKNLNVIALHPLFGPGFPFNSVKKFALIPVSDSVQELKTINLLFPENETTLVSLEDHDKSMAYLLSLPYFANLSFASAMIDQDINSLKNLSGTTFAVQLPLAESIMHNPDLITSLTLVNPYSIEVLDKFKNKLDLLIKSAKTNKESLGKEISLIKDGLEQDMDFDQSYKKFYKMYMSLAQD